MNRLLTEVSFAASIRRIGKRVLGNRARILRAYWRKPVPDLEAYTARLAGRKAFEIGGPSEIFSDHGVIPVYSVLASVDNCLFSAQTIWTGTVQGGSFQYHPKKSPGAQLFCEATDLHQVADSSYEALLASHCLEHVANPLRALEEWKRVLVEDGILLLILPHKDGTFDWHRPVTSLNHMIQDYENNVGESDLTHLPEILALHDLEKDAAAGSAEQFKKRCLANASTRAMHHHVFDTHTAATLLDHAGFQLVRVVALRPFHIIMLAAKCGYQTENSLFLRSDSEFLTSSPFPSDWRVR
jgi:hypothetical protein